IIHATFDSSITNNPNAAAIEAMINRSISIYELLFSDPITIEIRYRYSTTAPDGTPLPQGTLSQSDSVIYDIPWGVYINALRADATTDNDILANSSLPGNALSANIKPKGPNGRAVGLDTPPTMFANGTVGNGGPYDGIVTLNFSTNDGVTNIVNFNQNRSLDLGDWLSTACPQAHPYVQNAAGCRGQSSDVTATSPEGINLDVVGYDLVNAARAAVADFNND